MSARIYIPVCISVRNAAHTADSRSHTHPQALITVIHHFTLSFVSCTKPIAFLQPYAPNRVHVGVLPGPLHTTSRGSRGASAGCQRVSHDSRTVSVQFAADMCSTSSPATYGSGFRATVLIHTVWPRQSSDVMYPKRVVRHLNGSLVPMEMRFTYILNAVLVYLQVMKDTHT